MTIRIATLNLENLDGQPNQKSTLDQRIALMRSKLSRVKADILCLQEINRQEKQDSFQLRTLEKLLEGTPYTSYNKVFTTSTNGQPVKNQNLVILSRFPILEHQQYKHQFANLPSYQMVTANPSQTKAQQIHWERPVLFAKIQIAENQILHLVNVHLKSKITTKIPGQKVGDYTWKTASACAEGSFISSMKRVGQALEVRQLMDTLFDENEVALIVICGDFNSDTDDGPMQAIRGDVENTGNAKLASRVMVPCEHTVPESARFSLLHQGKPEMIDHNVISRSLPAHSGHGDSQRTAA